MAKSDLIMLQTGSRWRRWWCSQPNEISSSRCLGWLSLFQANTMSEISIKDDLSKLFPHLNSTVIIVGGRGAAHYQQQYLWKVILSVELYLYDSALQYSVSSCSWRQKVWMLIIRSVGRRGGIHHCIRVNHDPDHGHWVLLTSVIILLHLSTINSIINYHFICVLQLIKSQLKFYFWEQFQNFTFEGFPNKIDD